MQQRGESSQRNRRNRSALEIILAVDINCVVRQQLAPGNAISKRG